MSVLMVNPACYALPGAKLGEGVALARILQGDAVYRDGTTGLIGRANTGSDAKAAAIGIALDEALPGQPVSWIEEGDLESGGFPAPVPGALYFLGSYDGSIFPWADLVPGQRVTLLAFALNATGRLRVNIRRTGVVLGS